MSDQNNNMENLKQSFTNPTDNSGDFSQNDIENHKMMGILCYLGLLWLVPFFTAKDSKYVRFHLNQGLGIWAITIIDFVVCTIISFIPGIRNLVSIISLVFLLIVVAFIVMGIMNVVKGKAVKLPIIGDYMANLDLIK